MPKRPSRSGNQKSAENPAGGRTWRTPAGISAIGGLLSAIIAALALIVAARTDTTKSATVDNAKAVLPATPGTIPQGTDNSSVPSVRIDRNVTSVADLITLTNSFADSIPHVDAAETYSHLSSAGDNLSIDAPAAWSEQDFAPYLITEDGKDIPVGVSFIAVEDESRFYNSTDSPGTIVAVTDKSQGLIPAEEMQRYRRYWQKNCIEGARGTVIGGDASGIYNIWIQCGPTKTIGVDYIAEHAGGYTLFATFKIRDSSDLQRMDTVLRSVTVQTPIGIGESENRRRTLPGKALE